MVSNAMLTLLSYYQGCYDNTVNIWKSDGTKVLVIPGECSDWSISSLYRITIPGHTQPVKTVSWLSEQTFVSGGQDQVSVLIGQQSTLANAVF